MITQEQIMQEIRDLGSVVKDLEGEIKPLRARRDRLVVRAMEMGIPETYVARAASISRGWTHTLKTRAGLVKRHYHDKRTTSAHIQELQAKLNRARESQERKRERGMEID